MPPTILFAWSTFGPYHVARCDAVAALGRYRVLGVELASSTPTYEWKSVTAERRSFELIRLFERPANELSAIATAIRFRRLIAAVHPSAVFLPSYWPATSAAMLMASNAAGVPAVVMNETHAGTSKATGIALAVKRALVRSFDAALVGGNRQKEYLVSLGFAENRIALGYDAIDVNYFGEAARRARADAGTIRAKWNLPHRYLLSLGRYVGKKNLTVILDAYARLVDDQPQTDVALVFVGSGPMESELVARARDRGLITVHHGATNENASGGKGAVHFLPFMQIEDTPSLFALADGFVLASREEEWGLVVNEAMACGTPVLVSTAAGCVDELVVPGRTGLLFKPTSTDGLKACMAEVVNDPHRAAELGAAAAAHVRQWGCERFAAGALQAIDYALGRHMVKPPSSEAYVTPDL